MGSGAIMDEFVEIRNKKTGEKKKIPREQAIQRGLISEPSPEIKGWKGIGQDIASLPSKLIEVASNGAKAFPEEFLGLGQQALDSPSSLLREHFLSGLKGTHFLYNAPGELRDYFSKKEVIPENMPSFRFPNELVSNEFPEEYYREKMGIPHKPGSELAQLLPGLVATGPSLGRAAMRAGRLGQGIGRAASNIPQITNELTQQLIRNWSPSGYVARNYRGPLPIEDILSNARAAQDTFTPLGEVISSPSLKQQYENKILKTPFSNVSETLGQAENQVKNRAQNIVENIRPPELPIGRQDNDRMVQTILRSQQRQSRNTKNALYDNVSKLAEEQGWNTDLPSFTRMAEENWNILNDSPLLRSNDKFKSQFNKLFNFKNPTSKRSGLLVDANGQPLVNETIRPTFSQIKTIANDLDNKATELLNSLDAPSKETGRLYRDLAQSLRADVRNGIETNGTAELKNAFNEAEDFYKNDWARFLDPEIHNLTKGGRKAKAGDTMIQDIIKPGESRDARALIEKVQDIMPENLQSLLGYGYLQKASTKRAPGIRSSVTPYRLNKKINSLGNEQFDLLFTPEQRQQLLDFQNLKSMNPSAMQRMTNPKTGARLSKNTIKENLMNMLLGDMHTDPEFRNRVIQRMLDTEGAE